MKRWQQLLLAVAFSLMFLFISVGYAQVSDTLAVNGAILFEKEPKTVFITEVRVSGSSKITGTASVTQTGILTFKHGNYSLNGQTSGTGGAVTVSVTVKNNSGIDQYFGHHTASNENDINKLKNNCVVSYQQSGDGRLVENGKTKTFTFTIQNTTRNGVSLNNFESLLVFSPNFTDDATMNATDALAQSFTSVLSGKGPNGDGSGIIYQGREIAAEDIMDEIMSKMTSVDTGGYTGNVGNATQDEKDLISAVFGDNIVIQIGNNHYSVYVLIKNQQIDNRGENDMVIYITADQLNMGSGNWQGGGWGQQGSWQNLNYVPVYGLVFIKDGNNYKYCDHLFAGEAPVCDFGGALGEGKVGNFNTNLWASTELDVSDTSGGDIGEQYITTNGELDEAYQQYIRENPGALVDPDTLQ